MSSPLPIVSTTRARALQPLMQAMLNDELDQVAYQQTIQESIEARPVNTSKAYTSKANEFIEFCVDAGYEDGNTVTGIRL